MDVTCERCNTAYEFDDALVSDRGTTVKCTNCGHQFRIRRPEAQAQAAGPERWVVRTVDGRELEFRALRELQAAIAQATITREDVLSRGATRPRRLGSIAELDPFFSSAAGVVPVPGTAQGVGGVGLGPRMRVPTPQGLGAMAPQSQRHDGSVAIPLPIGPRPDDDDTMVRPTLNPRNPRPPAQSYRENAATVVARADYPGIVVSSADAPPVGRPAPRNDLVPAPPAVTIRQEAEGEELRGTASYGTPRESRTSDARYSDVLANSQPVMTPTPSNMRNSFTNEDYAEPRFSGPPRRAGVARWIVGFVLSGIVVLGAVTIGRRFLVTSGASAGTAGADERVAGLLQGGDNALAEGDLEGAQEQFDKASALAEKDAKVAAAVARIAVVRADVTWLRTKLLAADDPDLGGAQKMQKVDAERASRAADRAFEISPNDPTVTRLRIDALREAGDAQGARKLVPSIAAINGQPETGLTLASLDLGEEKIDFPTVLVRLRAAVAAEKNLGRARSMLIYALARSGDAPGAKAELDRLQALPRAHPLTQALRAFLARLGSVDLAALPEVGKEIPADWRDALKLAQEAKLKGDKKRVEVLLAAAIEKSKDDPEALAASADFKWESGDKAGATELYKKILEKAQPSSPWFKHAKERLDTKDKEREQEQRAPRRNNEVDEFTAEAQRRANQAAGIPTGSQPTGTVDTSDLPGGHPPPTTTHDAPPPQAPTSNAPPGVDTSDLPGFK